MAALRDLRRFVFGGNASPEGEAGEHGRRTCASSATCAVLKIPYDGHSPTEARAAARKVVDGWSRTRLLVWNGRYAHAVCRVIGTPFRDDLQLWFDDDEGEIYARSTSRFGRYDFGVNSTRLERLARDVRREWERK